MNNLDKYELVMHLMRKENVTKSEIIVLAYLYEHKTGTVNDISIELDLERSKINKAVKQMTEKQLVNRELDSDGKTYVYYINDNHRYFKEFYGKE